MSDTTTDPFQSFVDQQVSVFDDFLDALGMQLPQFAGLFDTIHRQVDAFEEVVDTWVNLSVQNFTGGPQPFAQINPTMNVDGAPLFGALAPASAPTSNLAFSTPDLGPFLGKFI
jgi:hypothetical protein